MSSRSSQNSSPPMIPKGTKSSPAGTTTTSCGSLISSPSLLPAPAPLNGGAAPTLSASFTATINNDALNLSESSSQTLLADDLYFSLTNANNHTLLNKWINVDETKHLALQSKEKKAHMTQQCRIVVKGAKHFSLQLSAGPTTEFLYPTWRYCRALESEGCLDGMHTYKEVEQWMMNHIKEVQHTLKQQHAISAGTGGYYSNDPRVNNLAGKRRSGIEAKPQHFGHDDVDSYSDECSGTGSTSDDDDERYAEIAGSLGHQRSPSPGGSTASPGIAPATAPAGSREPTPLGLSPQLSNTLPSPSTLPAAAGSRNSFLPAALKPTRSQITFSKSGGGVIMPAAKGGKVAEPSLPGETTIPGSNVVAPSGSSSHFTKSGGGVIVPKGGKARGVSLPAGGALGDDGGKSSAAISWAILQAHSGLLKLHVRPQTKEEWQNVELIRKQVRRNRTVLAMIFTIAYTAVMRYLSFDGYLLFLFFLECFVYYVGMNYKNLAKEMAKRGAKSRVNRVKDWFYFGVRRKDERVAAAADNYQDPQDLSEGDEDEYRGEE